MKKIILLAVALIFNDFVSDVFVALGRVLVRVAYWFGELPEVF